MLVASKYEEIYAPEIRDFIYMTDNAYSKDQVLELETDILRALDFNVTAPSPYRFLERFLKLSQSDDLIANFSRYILELSLLQTDFYRWRPSLLASSAVYIARKVLKRQEPWSPLMAQQTGFDERAVRACSKDLCLTIHKAPSTQEFQAIYKKFLMPRFMEVSKICAPSANNNNHQLPSNNEATSLVN